MPSASACWPSRKVRFWCDRQTMNRGGSMLHCVVKPTRHPSGPGAVTMNIGYSRSPTTPSNAFMTSVEHGPGDVCAASQVLAAVPEPVVERARGDAGLRGERFAGVHGARADLDLLGAALQELDPLVDLRGELGRVGQDAGEPQDVWDEVVGEDRQAVDVRKVRDTGEL